MLSSRRDRESRRIKSQTVIDNLSLVKSTVARNSCRARMKARTNVSKSSIMIEGQESGMISKCIESKREFSRGSRVKERSGARNKMRKEN